MRKRIKKPAFAIYGITSMLVNFVQDKIRDRGYGNKRAAWWYDNGVTYATISDYGSERTIFVIGAYRGQN